MAFPRPVRRRVAPAGDGGTPQTFDAQVQADADDGVTIGGTFLPGNINSCGESFGIHDCWFRFTSVTIPQGATIDAAYISLMAHFNTTDGAGTKTNIYLEDADDAAAPTDATDHAGKARTTAFGAWDDYDFPDTTNFYDSPSIVSVVQEVVDRGTWASGNALQILQDDDGSSSGKRYITRRHEDAGGANAAKIHVDFTA